LIFDSLILDFVITTESEISSAIWIVGASAFARGFGVTGRRDKFQAKFKR
jgi:hypothetical protein